MDTEQENEQEPFIAWIEAELKRRSWSHAELARRADTHRGSVSNVLSQTRRVGPDLAVAFADALDVDREWVFRKLGWLPETEPPDEELLNLVNTLCPRHYAIILDMAQTFYRHRDQGSKPEPEPDVNQIAP